MRHVLTTASLFGMASLSLSILVLGGCPDRTISTVDPQQGRVEFTTYPVNLNRNIDILFVIDDSVSMFDKQENLKRNFPRFINVLETIQGGLPDVHLGVVSSDMGTSSTQEAPGPNVGTGTGSCSGTGKAGKLQTYSAPVNGSFIFDIKQMDGSRSTNYTGTLSDAFTAMASAGAAGCGFEQHLSAMKAALDGTNIENDGFLRPDAFLAVIFLADEDDCSMSHNALLGTDTNLLGLRQSFRCNRFGHICDVDGSNSDEMNIVGTKDQCHPTSSTQYLENIDYYENFLNSLKPPDSGQVIVAGIMGEYTADTTYAVELRVPPGSGQTTPVQAVAHSCSYEGASGPEVADPAVRIQDFLNRFPNRSTSTTICNNDLSDGLVLIANLLKTVIGDPCINGTLADADPNTAGIQYDCSVSDFANYGKANQTETVIPQCNDALSNKPCWHLVKDTTNCATTPTQLTLKIERDSAPPTNTQVVSYCRTEVVSQP